MEGRPAAQAAPRVPRRSICPSGTSVRDETATSCSIRGSFNTHMFGDPAPADGGIDEFLATREGWWVFKGDELFISGNPTVDSTGGPRDLILGATGDILFTETPPFDLAGAETGDRWTLDGNTDGLVLTTNTGSITQSGFQLTGTSQDIAFYAYGATSDISLSGAAAKRSVVSVPGGTVQARAGRDVQIDVRFHYDSDPASP